LFVTHILKEKASLKLCFKEQLINDF
jgi:hypothetical protein